MLDWGQTEAILQAQTLVNSLSPRALVISLGLRIPLGFVILGTFANGEHQQR